MQALPPLAWLASVPGPQDHRMSMFSVTQPSRLSFHATFVSRKSQMALIQIPPQKTSTNSKTYLCKLHRPPLSLPSPRLSLALRLSLCTVCVSVCVLGPWKYCSLSAMATFLGSIVGGHTRVGVCVCACWKKCVWVAKINLIFYSVVLFEYTHQSGVVLTLN